jgi:peptide/nickel transport system substrate-binding protein
VVRERFNYLAILTAVAGVLALGLLTVGCGGGGTSDSSGASGSGATKEVTESGGDEGGENVLTIAAPNDLTSLDPAFIIDDQTHELVANVYDIGIGLGPTQTEVGEVLTSQTPEPEAFEKWTKSKDGLKYTFTLRKGMKFHSGAEVTASDVAYSYNRLLHTESGGKWAMENIIKDTKPVKATNKYTVVMEPDAPSTLATQMLFADTFAIVNQKDVEAHSTKADPWAEKWLSHNVADSSGPYIMTDYVKGQEIVLESFKEYWKGEPAYDKVIVKIVPSSAERLSLLQAGTVDMAEGLTPQQIDSIKNTPGITVSDGPTYRQTAIPLNTERKPLDDEKLRQAMSYGVNYDEIIESVYKGSAVRSIGPVPTGSPFALKSDEGYEFEPKKAEELLSESSYDGSEIHLLFNTEEPINEEVAVRVQNQLNAVGINVKLEPQSNTVFEEKEANKDYDMFLGSILAWIPDPDYIMNLFYECENLFNYSNYCNRNVDKAIEEGWGIFDFNKRYALFEKAQQEEIEAAPWIWIAQANFQLAMKDSVTGFITPQNLIPLYIHLKPSA